MNVLITGASGFIGSHVVEELLKHHYTITACIHKNPVNQDVINISIDFFTMQKVSDWLPYLDGIDVVINCVGIIAESKKQTFDVMHHVAPVALFKACEQSGVKRVIQISALSADDSALVAYHQSKKQADDYLRTSQLEWFILCPSLIYGEAGESFKWFKWMSNLYLIPLIGQGNQMIQPVHISTVVKTIEKCIHSNSNNQTIDVVGKQAISFKGWMTQLRDKPSNPRFIAFPMVFMKFVAYLLKPFKLKLISTDNLTMLEQNNTGDYAKLKSFLEDNK